MLTVHTVPEGRPVSLKITTGLTGEDAVFTESGISPMVPWGVTVN